MPRTAAMLIALAWSVASCGGSEGPTAAAKPEPPPQRETVFDPLTSTVGRAEGMQQTVDDEAAEQRRRIEEAAR